MAKLSGTWSFHCSVAARYCYTGSSGSLRSGGTWIAADGARIKAATTIAARMFSKPIPKSRKLSFTLAMPKLPPLQPRTCERDAKWHVRAILGGKVFVIGPEPAARIVAREASGFRRSHKSGVTATFDCDYDFLHGPRTLLFSKRGCCRSFHARSLAVPERIARSRRPQPLQSTDGRSPRARVVLARRSRVCSRAALRP